MINAANLEGWKSISVHTMVHGFGMPYNEYIPQNDIFWSICMKEIKERKKNSTQCAEKSLQPKYF